MKRDSIASDGFSTIDSVGGNTGLDIEDFMVKFSYAPPGSAHSLKVKLHTADQESEQTYLGLTRADYSADPYRRYLASAADVFRSARDSFTIAYKYRFSQDTSLTTRVYHAEYQRNWYKSEGIDFDGSPSAGDFSRTRWSSVMAAVDNNRAIGAYSVAALQAILNGGDTPEGSIELRHNNREYESEGIEALFVTRTSDAHLLTVGVRFHEDYESRLQHIDTYQQSGGRLLLNHSGLPGSAGNRLESADAFAAYITNVITLGKLELTPGARYEEVERTRVRWLENSDDPASRAESNFRDTRRNEFDVFLPGLGVRYDLTDTFSLIGSLHRGYTAASSDPASETEKSWNYEFGVRFHDGDATSWEAIVFFNDYDNLVGFCTASSGTDCGEVGDAFNAPGVTISGIEAAYTSSRLLSSGLELEWSINGTWLDTAFGSSFESALFGVVSVGDPLPFQPELQASAVVTLLADKWEVSGILSYTGDTCATAACAARERIDSMTTIDFNYRQRFRNRLELNVRTENLLDSDTIATIFPYGARPIKPQTFVVSGKWTF